MFLCLLIAGEARYVKLNLVIFHHISSASNSTSVDSIREQKNTKVRTVIYPHAKFEKAAPVTINQVKLTTSTKVSSLHIVRPK